MRVVALPGNHDVNVVDRASPARLELPGSPMKRLRQLRTLSALAMLQGTRLRTVESAAGRLGSSLADALAPHAADMVSFADGSAHPVQFARRVVGRELSSRAAARHRGRARNRRAELECRDAFLLHQCTRAAYRRNRPVGSRSPGDNTLAPAGSWRWHHHVIEYPQPAKALSERIGTALVNGTWFVPRVAAFRRPRRDHARPPACRLDRRMWWRHYRLGAVARDGGDRLHGDVFLRAQPRPLPRMAGSACSNRSGSVCPGRRSPRRRDRLGRNRCRNRVRCGTVPSDRGLRGLRPGQPHCWHPPRRPIGLDQELRKLIPSECAV